MAYHITSTDFADHLSKLYSAPPSVTEGRKWQHEQLGNIRLGMSGMPGIRVTDLDWQVPGNELVLTENGPANAAINISFQMSGGMHTRFAGIDHPLDMKAGTHNLVYLCEAGDSHVLNADQDLSLLQLTVEKDYFIQCLDEGSRWADSIIDQLTANRPFALARSPMSITHRMQQLVQNLKGNDTTGSMKKLMYQSQLLELMALQLEQFSGGATAKENGLPAGDRRKLQELKAWLEINFLEELSLSQVSRRFCLNEFKVKKGFRLEFGCTVFSYIRQLRMAHAQQLLRDTRLSVDEIADLSGYEHAHHFAKAFKDFSGYAPTIYRKNI